MPDYASQGWQHKGLQYMAERHLILWFDAGCNCGGNCNGACGTANCNSCTTSYPNCDFCDGMVLVPYDKAILVPPAQYIIAALVEGPTYSGGRASYTVSFDDSILANPAAALLQNDFKICCYDCAARVAELAAEFAAVDTATVDLNLSATRVLQANAKISATANNLIQANPDGLYAAQTPITVNDTASVDLTASGVANHTLQATVKVSPTVGNLLTVNPDGLFVSPSTNTDELVDNGNRTFTHTSVDGTPVVFCQGIQTINPAAGCLGIGNQNMIRAMSLDGCTLNVSSAPEHTGHAIGGPQTTFVGNVLNPISFTWVNPSACRSALVMVFTNHGVTYVQTTTSGNPILEAEFSAGGGFVGIQNLPSVNGATFQGNVGLQDTEFYIVPPGGSLVVYRRFRISNGTGAAFPGLTIGSWAAALRAVGWTI